mgnify:CR=1 FL=1
MSEVNLEKQDCSVLFSFVLLFARNKPASLQFVVSMGNGSS